MTNKIKQHPEYKNYKVEFYCKDGVPSDKIVQTLVQNLKEETNSSSNIKIGVFKKEKQIGKFAPEIQNLIDNDKQLVQVDCEDFIQDVLSVKDEQSLKNLQISGKVVCYMEQKLISQVENQIESGEQKSHKEISKYIQDILTKDSESKKLEKKCGVDVSCIELSHNPVIQSGGKYSLHALDNDDSKLVSDGIITKVSVTCNGYHSSIARTQFIGFNNDTTKEIYRQVINLEQLIFDQLVPGAVLSDIYQKGKAFIEANFTAHNLQNQIPNSFGQGIGLELKEDYIRIADDCRQIVKKGNVFSVEIGFKDIPFKEKKFAIQIIDTVIITENGAQCITKDINKDYEEISYVLSDSEEEEEEQNQQPQNRQSGGRRSTGQREQQQKQYQTRNARNQGQQRDTGKEQVRKEQQKKLQEKKIEEMRQRLQNDGFQMSMRGNQNIAVKDLKCYQDEEQLRGFPPGQISIDPKRFSVLLPIFGQLVPFHVSLIKNVLKSEDDDVMGLRINFNYPMNNKMAIAGLAFPELRGVDWAYVKELIFKNKKAEQIQKYINDINELKKKHKTALAHRQNEDEVQQEKLEQVQGKRPVLRELICRPALSSKKSAGILECHKNGFKYQTSKGERIDVIYKNIKFAIFQNCEHEMIACLHFHLHQEIVVGKKKTFDIQFYQEAGQGAQDLNDRRNQYDDDDGEEAEAQLRKKINRDFKAFIQAVEETVKEHDPTINLKFEKPYRKLGFYGSPLRSNVFLQPTPNCLVHVVETPFFVVSLKEIEIACFERMISGLKNFDLVFVFKDYDKPVVRITAIPTEHSEQLRDWLNSMEILFFDCTKPLNWPTILGEIKKDIAGFIEDGGWKNVMEESDDEQAGDDDEESEFEASDFSEEESEDDEDEGSDFDEDDESDFDEDDEEDDEEDFSEELEESRSPSPKRKAPIKKKR